MPQIQILDEQTIDKIAAGEVIERPASVVKELVENAIDAQATAITVEIKEGGISFVRITDNGCGIEKEQVPIAFLRHSTSKIRSVEDLMTVASLGFRGEALSSIAAVSQVEIITKTSSGISGARYVIEGGKEKTLEEIGAPEGTTFLVRNLFYNTPARRKFLKTPPTEAGYISDLMERMALSHPEVSFKFIVNNQVKLHTSGNSNLKEVIYHIYGRDIAANLIEIKQEFDTFSIEGFIGKPLISRGNRNYENYFINGRYVKSALIAKSIEDGYKSFVMQHKYPFTVLHLSIQGELLDVNVHPTKMELRFSNQEQIYEKISSTIREKINNSELIYKVTLDEKKSKEEKKKVTRKIPEPFEKKRLSAMQEIEKRDSSFATQEEIKKDRLSSVREAVKKDSPYERKYEEHPGTALRQRTMDTQTEKAEQSVLLKDEKEVQERADISSTNKTGQEGTCISGTKEAEREKIGISSTNKTGQEGTCISGTKEAEQEKSDAVYQQTTISDLLMKEKTTAYGVTAKEPETVRKTKNISGQLEKTNDLQTDGMQQERKLLDEASVPYHTIIGQVFDTYWLVQMENNLYIIDQHAAHEKVLYERTMKSLMDREYTSQAIFPPILLSLSMQEEELLKKYMDYFMQVGFVIEHFGGKEYAVTSVPANMLGLNEKELLIEMLDSLMQLRGNETPQIVLEKVASMSCKAAVKGNQRLSKAEMEKLIQELLTLENPYHCPHGRPTIISMSKYELEKKFKRVL